MNDKHTIKPLSGATSYLWAFIATGFGSGLWPWGPGTAGAFVATCMWWGVACLFSPEMLFVITLSAIVISTILGTIATNRLAPFWGEDPSRVVIDEMIGVWIPLLATPSLSIYTGYGCGRSLLFATLSFVLFRFFDMVKPLGIRRLDNRHGGFWVMADDILAGIYSLILILILRCLI